MLSHDGGESATTTSRVLLGLKGKGDLTDPHGLSIEAQVVVSFRSS